VIEYLLRKHGDLHEAGYETVVIYGETPSHLFNLKYRIIDRLLKVADKLTPKQVNAAAQRIYNNGKAW
jgi:hypothetical protein